jgi:LmbE family N-acetylglucosaminyl deacetylase
VLVVATRGEHGEVVDGVLEPGEHLADRRVAETCRAAEILGVARVEFLGYADSGMMGEPTNDAEGSFWSAPLDEAARRIASILEEERADVLTVYDEHGQYGHPDHIQVHRVGVRGAELAKTPRVLEATVNRDYVARLVDERGDEVPEIGDGPSAAELTTIGMPESMITTTVDVCDVLERKRAAMKAHASQIDESSWFLALPPDAFAAVFGQEWFIRRGAPAGTRETSILP